MWTCYAECPILYCQPLLYGLPAWAAKCFLQGAFRLSPEASQLQQSRESVRFFWTMTPSGKLSVRDCRITASFGPLMFRCMAGCCSMRGSFQIILTLYRVGLVNLQRWASIFYTDSLGSAHARSATKGTVGKRTTFKCSGADRLAMGTSLSAWFSQH